MAAEFVTAVDTLTLEYVDISKFQSQPGIGFSCGCSCPKCGKKVGARIFKNPESSCYFHEFDPSNRGCNGGGPETDLHLLAKQLLQQSSAIFLPDPGDQRKAVKFVYSNVQVEKKVGVLRPDLILTTADGQQLIVEITVTNKTFSNPIKIDKLHKLGIPAIEIKLNRILSSPIVLKNIDALDLSWFSKLYRWPLIDQIDNKTWLTTLPKAYNLVDVERKVDEGEPEDTSSGFWIFIVLIIIAGLLCYNFLTSKRKRKRRRNWNN